MIFHDRRDAGRQLAAKLSDLAGRRDLIVLALPRGGVPVGFEVARALGAPLDLFLVRKLGVPGREELAMGAIASGGVRFVNQDVVRALGIPDAVIDQVAAEEERELARREWEYRDDRPAPDVAGRVVLLVDDGLATGSTMRAAVLALRQRRPTAIIVAVPVGAAETCAAMKEVADDIVCAHVPEQFAAVGLWYEDFSQTTDEEVRELLAAGSAASSRADESARIPSPVQAEGSENHLLRHS
ncbi:MAG TPA: phosphoribosyltransferase [Gemmataceae bacterium]|jgi:predicted phosphoribosyltransferase|nr:phosphoribosyltransferase [Gemmataceae bacterium]